MKDYNFYFDTETAGKVSQYAFLAPTEKDIVKKWCKSIDSYKDYEAINDYQLKAGLIYPLSKVICISWAVGDKAVKSVIAKRTMNMNNYMEIPKAKVAKMFYELEYSYKKGGRIIAHNISFDISMLIKLWIDVMEGQIPSFLSRAAKLKPWDLNHNQKQWWDTAEFIKPNGRKLGLSDLCSMFKIPSPKDVISGAETHRVFWNVDDYATKKKLHYIDSIRTYCEKDVEALRSLYLKLDELF